jgi:hypothetical protein
MVYNICKTKQHNHNLQEERMEESCKHLFFFFPFFLFLVQGFELIAPSLLGRHSIT